VRGVDLARHEAIIGSSVPRCHPRGGQLKLIDGYKGNKDGSKKPNKHDGSVTPAEIKNYSRGMGTLQHFAKTVVWYSDNK